jgi:methylthioribose-1-phosphate isomerase
MQIPQQSIWYNPDKDCVEIIDQRKLPFEISIIALNSLQESFLAIKDMIVRGAPLIGVTAAYGLWLGVKSEKVLSELWLLKQVKYLKSSRPTAVNLESVLDRMYAFLAQFPTEQWKEKSLSFAQNIEQEEKEACEKIGEFGLPLIQAIYNKKKEPVNILTHCNAGWLACVTWGTATAPIYKAHLAGIPVHVWVDETRPRNQGARLTAWELKQAGVPYTVIPDNTGGHLMQHGMVDVVIVGSDRTTRKGDVANKIGTYLKALAAKANSIPFYVALPSSTIDLNISNGVKEIPIEQRNAEEVTCMEARFNNVLKEVELMPKDTPVANYGFDVTPAHLVRGLISEKGICEANEESITQMFLSND